MNLGWRVISCLSNKSMHKGTAYFGKYWSSRRHQATSSQIWWISDKITLHRTICEAQKWDEFKILVLLLAEISPIIFFLKVIKKVQVESWLQTKRTAKPHVWESLRRLNSLFTNDFIEKIQFTSLIVQYIWDKVPIEDNVLKNSCRTDDKQSYHEIKLTNRIQSPKKNKQPTPANFQFNLRHDCTSQEMIEYIYWILMGDYHTEEHIVWNMRQDKEYIDVLYTMK